MDGRLSCLTLGGEYVRVFVCVRARVAITVLTSEPVSVGIRVYDEGFSVNIRARACARCPCTCACWWWGRSFEDELYY